MNLKPRFLLLTIILFVIAAIPAWFAVRMLAEGIVEQWAILYAEKQALYDKSRTLQPIMREVALSRQLANSQYIRDWAHNPSDKTKTRRAIAEMENFRQNFTDRNYFVSLLKNGNYYFNNASNEFKGKELRYVLDPKAAKDAWFYDLIKQGKDLHINVNPDPELGITKLWIDVLIRDGNDILGIAGTGLDLTELVKNVVNEGTPGVSSLFVDHNGEVQLLRNQARVEPAGKAFESKTFDRLFTSEKDRKAILATMKELELQRKTVATTFVTVNGKRHLAGIVYLPEIAWYEITLLDLDVLLPFSNFFGILAAYAMILLGALFLFYLALERLVLKPLAQLDRAMSDVEAGTSTNEQLAQLGTGEVRHLMHRFTSMAHAVMDFRHNLEAKVQERTTALEYLTRIDPLTELLNRRGMTEAIEAKLARSERELLRVGILWIDVDDFKTLNDGLGHAIGDQALKVVGEIIRSTIRPYDLAARWGGDEFLIMVQPADSDTLNALGERLRMAINTNKQLIDEDGHAITMSASIGGHLARAGEPLDSILLQGDRALYAAKAAGRNCYKSSNHSPEQGISLRQATLLPIKGAL